MLEKDNSIRLSIKQALQHDWIINAANSKTGEYNIKKINSRNLSKYYVNFYFNFNFRINNNFYLKFKCIYR